MSERPRRPARAVRPLGLLALAFCVLAAGGGGCAGAAVPDRSVVRDLRVATGSRPFAGDGPLLATVSPDGDGLRDRAIVSFRLRLPALVEAQALGRDGGHVAAVWTERRRLPAGNARLVWRPARSTPPQTYMIRLRLRSALGSETIGSFDSRVEHLAPAPVVRVQGVDAGFRERSYAPGQEARLWIRCDARRLRVVVLRAGAERAWDSIGVPVARARSVRWRHRDRPAALPLRIGAWPSGLYFVRLDAGRGRVGYAPFVVRPRRLGRSRVAVVLPTNTWQAYNYWDSDGNGIGDSWYADSFRHSVALGRPYYQGGKPPHYRTDDRGFLRFLVHGGRRVDYLSDDDFERFRTGDRLARLYDLIVFEGHHEYETAHAYDLVERYRDLGGNLAFLSADNFYWRVVAKRGRLWRTRPWRTLGRPEARLVGVAYRANDYGGHSAPYTIVNRSAGAWLFAGLPAADGGTLGSARYGIEYDSTTPDSPPGTKVLAEVDPHFADPTIRGQMTYYTTKAGAKVFAAGTLSFGGSDNPTGTVLFRNLWRYLRRP